MAEIVKTNSRVVATIKHDETEIRKLRAIIQAWNANNPGDQDAIVLENFYFSIPGV
jgi:DNA polymerase III delta prime subunit